MLRVAYLSDLHIDNVGDGGKNIIGLVDKNKDKFDVLVVAGDVSNYAPEVFEFIRKISVILERNLKAQVVIYTPGNHEYYNFEMRWVDSVLGKMTEMRNVKVLMGPNSYTHYKTEKNGDVLSYLFVGGTMWTDFELFGERRVYMNEAMMRMNDFNRVINYDEKVLHPEDTVKYFNIATENMKFNIMHRNSSDKIIVVTHHTPSVNSIHERYECNSLNPAFTSGLLDIDHPSYQSWTSLVDVWIHGHTHDCFDYEIDHVGSKTRVLCNPRGYKLRNGSYENEIFNFKVAEI